MTMKQVITINPHEIRVKGLKNFIVTLFKWDLFNGEQIQIK